MINLKVLYLFWIFINLLQQVKKTLLRLKPITSKIFSKLHAIGFSSLNEWTVLLLYNWIIIHVIEQE